MNSKRSRTIVLGGMTRIESEFSLGVAYKDVIERGCEYYRLCIEVARDLSQLELNRLKISARAWKLVMIPVLEANNKDLVKVLNEAQKYYSIFSQDNQIYLLRILKFRIINLKDESFALEFKTLLWSSLREGRGGERGNNESWQLYYDFCHSKGELGKFIKVFSYSRFKLQINATVCIHRDYHNLFEDNFIEFIQTSNFDERLPYRLQQRLKSLSPTQGIDLLNSTSLSMLWCRGFLKQFLDLSILISTINLNGSQVLWWITCLLFKLSFTNVDDSCKVETSLIVWICTNLNRIKRANGEHQTVSPLQMSYPDLESVNNLTISQEQLIYDCISICKQSSMSNFITWNGNLFKLGSAYLPESNIKLSETSFKVSDKSKHSIRKGLDEEIKNLCNQREELFKRQANMKSFGLNSIFVLDSNILIDRIDLIRDVLNHRNVEFAIPLIVIEELNGLLNSTIKQPIIRIVLDSLLEIQNMSSRLGHIRSLSMNGKLRDDLELIHEEYPLGKSIRNNDDAIIYAASKCSNAVIVSDDVNLSLRARARSVNVVTWDNFFDFITANA